MCQIGEIYVTWGSFRPLTIPEEVREYDICFVIGEGEKKYGDRCYYIESKIGRGGFEQ